MKYNKYLVFNTKTNKILEGFSNKEILKHWFKENNKRHYEYLEIEVLRKTLLR